MKSNIFKITIISILAIVLLDKFFIYISNGDVEIKSRFSMRAQEDAKYRQGENLFVENCTACHSAEMSKIATAPALGGITKRKTKKWLYAYTRNANSSVFKNEPIKKKFWGLMFSFPNMKGQEMDAIYYFVEQRYQMTLNGVPAKIYFRFDEKENNKAKVCLHVMNDKKPILYIYRTKSKEWYFGCDKKHIPSDWKPTTLHYIFDLDDSINEVDCLIPGFAAKRKSKEAEWEDGEKLTL